MKQHKNREPEPKKSLIGSGSLFLFEKMKKTNRNIGIRKSKTYVCSVINNLKYVLLTAYNAYKECQSDKCNVVSKVWLCHRNAKLQYV